MSFIKSKVGEMNGRVGRVEGSSDMREEIAKLRRQLERETKRSSQTKSEIDASINLFAKQHQNQIHGLIIENKNTSL